MAYFGCYMVNPNVQTVSNIYGKGGKWVLKAELQAAEVDPHFEKNVYLRRTKEQARSQFSKYRFQNKSALAHNL